MQDIQRLKRKPLPFLVKQKWTKTNKYLLRSVSHGCCNFRLQLSLQACKEQPTHIYQVQESAACVLLPCSKSISYMILFCVSFRWAYRNCLCRDFGNVVNYTDTQYEWKLAHYFCAWSEFDIVLYPWTDPISSGDSGSIVLFLHKCSQITLFVMC